MTSKHTPGPWEVSVGRVYDSYKDTPESLKWGTDALIADCFPPSNYRISCEEKAANAHFIANAPAMYEALKLVKRALDSAEWRDWEGQAIAMAGRAGFPKGSGYQGEQFMAAVNAVLDEVENRDE